MPNKLMQKIVSKSLCFLCKMQLSKNGENANLQLEVGSSILPWCMCAVVCVYMCMCHGILVHILLIFSGRLLSSMALLGELLWCFKLSSMEVYDCLVLQLMQDIRSGEHESDFTGTPKIPVYVKISVKCPLFAAIISCIEINLLISS